MDKAYEMLLQGAMILLGACLFLCLIRAVKGPTPADRVIAINMIGTVTIFLIILLTLLMGEGYLTDIGLIYAMLSFLSVVILCRIYIGAHKARQAREGNKDA